MKYTSLFFIVPFILFSACNNNNGEDPGPGDGPDPGDERFITDDNFYNLCLRLHDYDGDGVFSEEDAALVVELILNNESIYSLEGIEYFTSLEYLDCTENFITEIDVSSIGSLRVLNANFNPLERIDISGNPLLEELWCSPRDKGEGKLRTLDISKNPRIKSLIANRLGLTELNLGNNSALTELYCSNNSIRSLDLSACSGLVELQATAAGLRSLILPLTGKLTRLSIESNELTSLDMTSQSSIVSLACSVNPIGSLLNIADCPELLTLSCEQCGLATLDVSQLLALRSLNIRNNTITRIDLTKNTALRYLYASGNPGISIPITRINYDNLILNDLAGTYFDFQ